MTDEDMKRLWHRLFHEAMDDTNRAVDLLRRCLEEAKMTIHLCADVSKFIKEWDEAGQQKDTRVTSSS